jgi:hypothetical protein
MRPPIRAGFPMTLQCRPTVIICTGQALGQYGDNEDATAQRGRRVRQLKTNLVGTGAFGFVPKLVERCDEMFPIDLC